MKNLWIWIKKKLVTNYTISISNVKDSNISITVDGKKVCSNCGCGNPKKTYYGYWCNYCDNEM